VRIAYAIHGTGPPLVFARGWISHLDLLWEDPEFRPFFEAIGRCFTVVRYDTRGNGLSQRDVCGRLSLDELVLDLEAVIDKLALNDVVLYATCYGGPIAARYAARHPDRVVKLALDGTYAAGATLASGEMRESVLSIVKMLRVQPRAAETMLDYFTNPEESDLREMRLDRLRLAIRADVAAELYELSFELDVTDDLRAVAAPTLVTHRRRTRAVPYALGQEVAALVPDAHFVSLDGVPHNPWEGNAAAEALRALGDFLEAPIASSFVPRSNVRPTVILFTDMEGSTAINSRMGDDRAHELLRAHDAIVRRIIDAPRRGGRQVKSMGDGVMAAFSSVSQALAVAVDLQQSVAQLRDDTTDTAVRIRVGINAGEPLADGDDLHGLVVSTAARICAHAAGGEILVSNVVRELATGKGFRFADIGPVELKGIDGPMHLYRVTV